MFGMSYNVPRQWPPTRADKPPIDDWIPPEFWEPNPNGFPISPDGDFKLVRSKVEARIEATEAESHQTQIEVANRMLGVWARAVLKDVHSYYQAAMRAAWIDRAIDYGEDWSPNSEDLSTALEEVWVRGYRLLTSDQQMERWLQATRRLSGDPVEPGKYTALRNTLEHLDEAKFDELTARKDPDTARQKGRSINDLPGKELFLGFHATFTEFAFGIANLQEIFDDAKSYSRIGRPVDDYEPSAEDIESYRRYADEWESSGSDWSSEAR